MSFELTIVCDFPGCREHTEPIRLMQDALPSPPDGWYSYVPLGSLMWQVKLNHAGEIRHACPAHALQMGIGIKNANLDSKIS